MMDNNNFGYVKFESEIEPLYTLVNIQIVTTWFQEFETSIETFADIGFEFNGNYRIINYQPIANYVIFEKLYQYVHICKAPNFASTHEQINFIQLLCRLANKDKLNEIIKGIEFDPYVWPTLMSLEFDAKTFFDDHVKILACFFTVHLSPTKDNWKNILNYYGVMWCSTSNNEIPKLSDILSEGKTRRYLWDEIDKVRFLQIFDKKDFVHKVMRINDDIVIVYDKLPYVKPVGPVGPTGATGATGPVGVIGYPGPVGVAGAVGMVGPTNAVIGSEHTIISGDNNHVIGSEHTIVSSATNHMIGCPRSEESKGPIGSCGNVGLKKPTSRDVTVYLMENVMTMEVYYDFTKNVQFTLYPQDHQPSGHINFRR